MTGSNTPRYQVHFNQKSVSNFHPLVKGNGDLGCKENDSSERFGVRFRLAKALSRKQIQFSKGTMLNFDIS